MIAPARVAAYEILRAVSAGRSDLPTAVAEARVGLKDDRDRALAAEIATGVQRWRAALDHVIAHAAKRRTSDAAGEDGGPAIRVECAGKARVGGRTVEVLLEIVFA